MAKVNIVKVLKDGVVINFEGNRSCYKIPLEDEVAKAYFISKILDGYTVMFTSETKYDLDRGSSDSSIAFYRSRWGIIQGNYEVLYERDWKWESGSAGGSGTKTLVEFEKGAIFWKYVNSSTHGKSKVIYIVGDEREYVYTDDELVKKTVKEYFPNNWKEWMKYAKKQGWDKDLDYLAYELGQAEVVMRYFFDEEDFTPENYELAKKAREVGIEWNPLGIYPMTPRLLREMIETIEQYGWDFSELEWVIREYKSHWDYVLIYYANGMGEHVGKEVGELIRKIANELEKEGIDVDVYVVKSNLYSIFNSEYLENLKKEFGDAIIIREGGVGRFANFTLAYCRKEDWDKIKENLEQYLTERIKQITERSKRFREGEEDEEYLIEDGEDFSPSP